MNEDENVKAEDGFAIIAVVAIAVIMHAFTRKRFTVASQSPTSRAPMLLAEVRVKAVERNAELVEQNVGVGTLSCSGGCLRLGRSDGRPIRGEERRSSVDCAVTEHGNRAKGKYSIMLYMTIRTGRMATRRGRIQPRRMVLLSSERPNCKEMQKVVVKYPQTSGKRGLVYDGYLCIQRLNAAANNDIDLIFAWDPAEPVATRPLMIEKPGKCMLHVTHDGNKNVSDLVFFKNGSGVATHYEYAPFGAVTVSTRDSSSTDYDFRTYNPYRFSSEYADDTLGLVYYNYRHYEPQAGMWLSRDPYFGVCDNNGYLMCGNETLGFVDVLGLWSSVGIGTHQYMVARGMRQAIGELENKVACLNNRLTRMLITSAIVDGNERMDDPKEEAFSAPTAAALPLHYNRAMAQKPEDAIRRFNDGVRERRKFLEELQKFEFSTPSDDTCKAALDKLGQLTHMLQDYYGHGVGWDYVVGSKDSLIGNAYGEPDMVAGYEELLGSIGLLSSFVLKPSSYSGMFHKSEHGPLWWREPGYRAPDTEKRKKLSIEATAKEMERFLPIWCDKCCKTLERMRSER